MGRGTFPVLAPVAQLDRASAFEASSHSEPQRPQFDPDTRAEVARFFAARDRALRVLRGAR